MKKLTRFLAASFYLLLCAAGASRVAAADKPNATLRQVGAEYYIDILTRARHKTGTQVAAVMYRTEGGQRRKVAGSGNVGDCGGRQPLAGQFCKEADAAGNLRIRYRFDARPDPDADYFVAFDMVAIDPVDATRSSDFGLFLNTGRDSAVSAPVVNSLDEFDDKKILAIVVAVPAGAMNLDPTLIRNQIGAIYDWVEQQQANPAASVDVWLEPLTQKAKIPYPVSGIAISPPRRCAAKPIRASPSFSTATRRCPPRSSTSRLTSKTTRRLS